MRPPPSGSTNSMRPQYGKVSSAGSTICTTWPCAPLPESWVIVRRTSPISLHRSDSSTISASGEGAEVSAAGSCVRCDRARSPAPSVRRRCGCRSGASGREFRRARRLRPELRPAPAPPPACGRAWCRAPAARQTPSTASGRARSTPCARPPIPARAHRDDRRAPSAASRRARPARRIRSGDIARNSRPVRRGGGRAGRGSRWPRRAALPESAAASRRRAFGLRRPHAATAGRSARCAPGLDRHPPIRSAPSAARSPLRCSRPRRAR